MRSLYTSSITLGLIGLLAACGPATPGAGGPDATTPDAGAADCTGEADCDDGVACTIDQCGAGGCSSEPCADCCPGGEVCQLVVGCVPANADCDTAEDCSLGRACDGQWSCDVELGCQYEGPVDCDDHDDCTADRCDDAAGGCVHQPTSGPGCGPVFTCESGDVWKPTTLEGAPAGRYWQGAVWTGTEMMVWGGVGMGASTYDYLSTGGLYDPATDSWRPTSVVGAPSGRLDMVMVWSGSEVLVWSGRSNGGGLDSGGRYDPLADVWRPMSTDNAPPATAEPEGVWSGTEMIVWGDDAVTGGRYDPLTDTWTPMTTTASPLPRDEYVMTWNGSQVLVWGGRACGGGSCPYVNSGGRYDPLADAWTSTSTAGAPLGVGFGTGVWTGSELVVFGGRTCGFVDGCEVNSGGRYDPVADSWKPLSSTGAPSPRHTQEAQWTGDRMVIWGGGAALLGDGALYDPVANVWTPMNGVGAPAGRRLFSSVWTGSAMIVWGGISTTAEMAQSGGIYCPP